jgi:long-chain acyl-CoA synthetase
MTADLTYLDKPWLKSYKLGPYRLDQSLAPLPVVPAYQTLYDAAEKYPNQTAILFQGRGIKYAQLRQQVDQLAAALSSLGVRKGDRVCIFLPNCIEFILSDWGVMRAGAVVVPTSILRSDEGFLHELNSSASKVIICREDHLERVLSLKKQCELEHVIVTSSQGYDVQEVSCSLPNGVHDLRKLLNDFPPAPPEIPIKPQEDLCELAFTGGATGVPKGVMITHYNRSSDIRMGLPWVMKPMLRVFVGKASVLIPIPLFHT